MSSDGYFGNLRTNSEAFHVFKPAARTATATGTEVDLRNGTEHVIIFDLGVWTDGVFTFTVKDSPRDADGTSGTFTAVTAAFLDGPTGIVESNGTYIIDAANEDEKIVMITYTGGGDFLRVDFTASGTTTGMVFSVMVVTTGLRATGNTPMRSNAAW